VFNSDYQVLWIPPGMAGTRQTLYEMARVARQDSQEPSIQALAQSYPSPIFIEQFFRLVWVVVPDPDEFEFIRAPKLQAEQFFQAGILEGDCDDASTLASCILKCLRWPNVMTAIRRRGEPEFSHVFTQAIEDNYLISIDPIVPAARMPIQDIAETMQVHI